MEWAEVISNPFLQNLPFKIELNRFGKILMTPASNQHGRIQGRMAANLINKLPDGEVITECSIRTFAYETPYPKAPEICIEIVSSSNSKAEMTGKVELYLAKGAQEVWVIYEGGRITTYSHVGEIEKSALVPDAQKL